MQTLLRRLALCSLALLAVCSTPPSLTCAQVQPADSAEAIGSSRNSRTAYPFPAGTKPTLTYLAGPMSDAELDKLKSLATNVRIISGLNRDSALTHAAAAQAIDARLLSPALLEKASNLVWVHSPSAGVDRFMSMDALVKNDRIVLTNSRAVHGPAIADHAFAMLLSLTRHMGFHAQSQRSATWDRDDPGPRPIALQGRTMLVVGIGGIGAEIAQRAHGFGMRVIATRRTDSPAPDYVAKVGKPADLLAMLPEADVVAVCVPLTPETDHLFNQQAFEAMKPGSYLINIARGRIVQTDALLAALKDGRLAGACLDVTDPEPLPPGHAIWKQPNVIITPHVAADADLTQERAQTLFRENFRRFCAGEPLLNVVDKQAGY